MTDHSYQEGYGSSNPARGTNGLVRRLATPAALVLALSLGACTGGGSDETTSSVAPTTSEEPAGSAVPTTTEGESSGGGQVAPEIEIVALDQDSDYRASLCAVPIEDFFDEPDPLAALAAAIDQVRTLSPAEADEKAEIVRRLERVAAAEVPEIADVQIVGDILAARCGP